MLYHYSTWRGQKLAQDGIIKPRNTYAQYTRQAGMYHPVIFLTSDPTWEPSVQAATTEHYWEKCGSDPEVYAQLGIPCFSNGLRYCEQQGLMLMVEDAMKLGSDVTKWKVAYENLPVYQICKWEGAWISL